MSRLWLVALVVAGSVFLVGETARSDGPSGFVVVPAEVKLSGNFARTQLVVTRSDAGGQIGERSEDLTSGAAFQSSDANVVAVDSRGQLLAKSNGSAKVSVKVGDVSKEIAVTVEKVEPVANVGYVEHVTPILNKAGCSMGACHAAQHGQGGFKLSVFGSELDQDREAIVRDRAQRRLSFVEPDASLFLKKPTMQVPHGGGKRLAAGSVDYEFLKAWIANGAPKPEANAPEVTKVSVFPPKRLGGVGLKQQLRVDATYSDGSKRDVTAWAKYDSMDDGMLTVNGDGLVTVTGQGQAPVMVRFEGQAEISLFVIPYRESIELTGWTNNNFIDELASAKFKELGIDPSPLCDDATFIRRAFLDAIGQVPTLEETTAFIAETDPAKRTKLIDRLLGLTGDSKLDIYNDAYSAWWTLKWSDLLRNTTTGRAEQGMWAMHNWLRTVFRENWSYDRLVRELVTAKGSVFSNGPANYFSANNNPTESTESTVQLFLGVRMECAKCHHHPFEKYGQGDYYGFAAFFARVSNKSSEEFGAFGGESVVIVRTTGEVSHPKTGKVLKPTPLEGESVDHPLDRRIALADWMTSKNNGMFARSIVNRYMGYLMGRGLVDPVDDMRSTNPPTNPPLMDALAKHFAESGFNLKQLMRTIMTSRLYQLDSQPTATNASDRRFYAYYRVKRLSAEALLDAIDRAAGTQTKFKNLPLGTKAIELPDAEYPDFFLNVFAKPKRASVCECERSPDENLAQALHTLNGDIIANKLADAKGRIATLLAFKSADGKAKPHEEIVRELYLAALCRQPSDAELAASHKFLEQAGSPKECYEDLLWALINSKQFLFVR
ncbi:MAG: DUF1553 domain-containing protein [Planctomycetota bacterium]|nr:MAG: DUF1553 domain-containing protein [Planctomycetota bacterium]